MEIAAAQFSRIEPFLPIQRGNVSLGNLQVVNAILYVAEHDSEAAGPPKFIWLPRMLGALSHSS
jgi:hypothetical protein